MAMLSGCVRCQHRKEHVVMLSRVALAQRGRIPYELGRSRCAFESERCEESATAARGQATVVPAGRLRLDARRNEEVVQAQMDASLRPTLSSRQTYNSWRRRRGAILGVSGEALSSRSAQAAKAHESLFVL